MSMYKRICRECGKEFEGGPRAWYCPECRNERRLERQRIYWRNGYTRKIGSTDCCEMCGKPYTVNSGLQRYCSECAKINQLETDRRLSLEYYGNNKETLNPKRNAKRREIWRKEYVKKKRDVIWTIENGNGKVYETDNVTDFVRQYIVENPDEETVIKIRGRLCEMWYDRHHKKHTDRDYNGWKIVDKKVLKNIKTLTKDGGENDEIIAKQKAQFQGEKT